MGFQSKREFKSDNREVVTQHVNRLATDNQIKGAERRLELWGHDVKRVGYYSGSWLVDGERCGSARLIEMSKGL